MVVILISVFINSCAKDGASHSDFANQNVELRSRCGDNYNLAPTPTYSVNLENGLCCYSFTFTGIANGLGYEIYGLNNNGTYIGGPIGSNTYCSGTLVGTTIIKCCLDTSIKTVNIVLSNGSCVTIELTGCN